MPPPFRGASRLARRQNCRQATKATLLSSPAPPTSQGPWLPGTVPTVFSPFLAVNRG